MRLAGIDLFPVGIKAFVFALFVTFLFFSKQALAQPANNNWANAISVPIPNNNFGVGVIQSPMVNMTGATNQPGEYLQNPTYNKTVWYKFSIPAHRLVRVKVMQPTEIMQSTDAGFFVYHSTPSIPGAGDLATYTAMFSIASYSENVCLEQGEYYVQVIAKNAANSELFVELDVSYTYPVSTGYANDQVESAANIGTLVANNYQSFSWDCLSIQSEQEYNSYFAADSINFTKSIWYRFTTDNHIDLFSFFVGYPVWALNNAPVSVRIFEGAVDLATMDTSAAIYSTVRPMNGNYTHLFCELKPNTEYYVQILGRIDYTGTSNFYLRHLGENITTGAYPQEAAFNPLNDFGTVVPVPSPGVTVTRQDYFSCEALLTNDSIQCGVVNPPDAVTIGATNYDLTTWFTIDVPNPANVLLRAYVQNQYCNSQYYNHYMYVRIFNQTPDNDCVNFVLPGSLYYEGPFDANGAIVMNCLPAGNYSIQLLGRSNIAADPYHCSNSQFGRRVNFSINLMGVPTTEYALLSAGDVDWINTANPLMDNILYTADSSSFSCDKTVIPDTAICSNLVDRAMYRQFIIGDADNDAVPDSGMVTIENFNYYDEIQNHLVKSVFYRGDAEQLAAAQNTYSWPQQIDGLDPYQGCNMYNAYFRPSWPYTVPHNPKKFCVTPGTYTLVNVGDSTENGAIMAPRFRFTKSTTNHWDPANAYGMGDIIAQGLNVTSPADTFSCRDNAVTIAGLAPCAGYTKLIYREFYISQDCRITVDEISSTTNPPTQMRVFSGRVSTDGIAGLTLAPYHGGGCYSHYSDYNQPACATVPAGWYTAVSYGYGPTYDNNYAFHEATTYTNYTNLYNIDHTSAIRVLADTTVPPGPFFNRPYKACVANNDNPLTWVNNGTASIPSGPTNYTLCMERFKAMTDTPFAAIPILGCSNTVRLAFYVFTIDAEYYVRITGVDGWNKELYPLDVRVDSLLLPTTPPIATCNNTGNMIEVCRLQPGTYTLVVYGTPAQDCVTFTPAIAVQPVEISRFDFAVNAYDFGLVPGDNVYHPGKVGDVHPTDASLLPTNDFFYCTTGALPSDPSGACTGTIYPNIYPDTINNAYYQEPGTQTWYKRRNLWYTFVVQGMGAASITIRNLTTPSEPVAFKMYYSDVDGNIPFEDLYALGEQDSTMAAGLTLVHHNITPSWCNRYQESTYTFINDICLVDTLKRRYYIVAELDEYYIGFPNVQMDLQIRWAPINSNPQDPKYDFYSEANVLGNNEDAPPYSDIALEYDTPYVGGWGNMSCATGDTADYVFYNDYWGCQYYSMDQRSLWWKFRVDQPGFIRLAAESDATAASNFSRRLLKQVAPGDSIISINGTTDLQSWGTGTNVGVPGSPLQWYRYCIDPGVYYYHVQRCADVDTSNVRAHAYFTTITGDNCSNAVAGSTSTFGTYPLSIPLLCHSMGGDFGEDGSNMGCLQGPDGYRSTWFKFSYTGTELADILFQLNLSGLGNYISPANVRYRLFYGNDCATMIAGQECSTNAYINNSIACVSGDEGDFYVQVVYPESTTGTLGFTFTVSETTNPDCSPFNPTLMISDYFYQPNCTGDSLIFFNYATSGSSVEYLWDFGDGETSTENNPVHAYTPGDYDVTLYVINPILNDTVSSIQTVTLSPTGSPLELGDDITICLGDYATIGQSLTQATYEWSTNETSDLIQVSNPGWYYLDIEWGGCPYSDSIQINVLDLAFDLGPDVSFCAGDHVVLQPVVYPGVDFLWSDNSTADTLLIAQSGNYYLDISIGDCVQSDTVVVDVIQPIEPVVIYDDFYCTNEYEVELPIIPATTGNYYYQNAIITDLLISGLNAGDHDLEYRYMDDATNCPWEIILPFEIADTTTLTFTSVPEICIDAAPFVLNSIVNVSGGDFKVSYTQGEQPTLSSQTYNPSNITSNAVTPVIFDLYYAYTNSATCVSETFGSIEVNPLPVVSFTVNAVCLNDTAEFVNDSYVNGSVISSYLWEMDNFSDFTSPIPHPVYYNQPNSYPVTLTVESSIGCSNSYTTDLLVHDLPQLMVDPYGPFCKNDGAIDLPIASPLNGTWWNGAAQVNGLNTYNLELNNTLQYRVTDANNCSNYVDVPFAVNDTTTLSLTGTINPLCIDAGEADYNNVINVIGGQWSALYDGTSWMNASPFDTDAIEGFVGSPLSIPLLYEYNNEHNCLSTLETHVAVHPLPVIDIDVIDACANSEIEIVNNSSVNGSFVQSTDWNFEQHGGTSQFQPQGLSYAQEGDYDYTLNVTSSIGCIADTSGNITIYPLPIADFDWEGICVNESILFSDASSISSGDIVGYSWTLNNNEFSDESTATHTFIVQGNYEITLQVATERGCIDINTNQIEIVPLPTGVIQTNNHCLGENTLIESQYAPNSGSIVSSLWNIPGQVNNLSTPSVLHLFDAPGIYQIEQAIISDSGCENILHGAVEVYPLPIPSFVTDDFELCLFDADTIVGTSQIEPPFNITAHQWSFSNGVESSGASVVFVGAPVGSIDLQLTAISNLGCEASMTYEDVYLVQPNPIADFTLSPEVLSYEQPDLRVEDISAGSTSWQYNVSDGSNYDEQDFVHRIEEAGYYDITQIVVNQYGCKDTISKSIEFVHGLIVHIPNTFTPDDDGLNDVFGPVILGEDLVKYNFIIWDRWGMEIFNSQDRHQKWIGNVLNGEHYAKDGVYNYRLIVKGKTLEEQVFSGSVTLLR